jgi:hypothetical protein
MANYLTFSNLNVKCYINVCFYQKYGKMWCILSKYGSKYQWPYQKYCICVQPIKNLSVIWNQKQNEGKIQWKRKSYSVGEFFVCMLIKITPNWYEFFR